MKPIASLRVALCVVAMASSLSLFPSLASAGTIVPWLTGPVVVSGIVFDITVVQTDGQWSASVPVGGIGCNPTPTQPECSWAATGDLTGGTMSIDLAQNNQNYHFDAQFTSGLYVASGTAQCFQFVMGECEEDFTTFAETDQFSFAGQWNNGWGSVGQLSGGIQQDCFPFCVLVYWAGNGSIVTTATPEPSTFLMVGSGILGAARVLRRRLKPGM